jgi:hypothetical protein
LSRIFVRIQGVIRTHNKLCNLQATLKDGQKKTINDFIFVFFVPFVVKKQPLRLGIKTQQQKLTTIPLLYKQIPQSQSAVNIRRPPHKGIKRKGSLYLR